MKLQKLIVSLAAAVCAVCSAHAQTNTATFTGTLTLQGPLVDTKTASSIANITSELNTAGLIAELAKVIPTNFSKTAKLEAISVSNTNTQFAVSDGTNFVLIPTNIVNISSPTNTIISGMENNTSLHEKQLMIFQMDFNDVGLGGSDLQFSLSGIGSISTVATATSTTISARITMLGYGKQGGTNLVVTATLSGSGRQ